MKPIIDKLRKRLEEISRRMSVIKNAPKPTPNDFLINNGKLQAMADEQVFLAQLISDLEKQ